jgi:hypothetical protein
MTLTGKAKKSFEKWYYKEIHYVGLCDIDMHLSQTINALIIEWFDSVGVYINIEPKRVIDSWIFDVLINKEVHSVWSTRQEATTKAIEKANEIYNNL